MIDATVAAHYGCQSKSFIRVRGAVPDTQGKSVSIPAAGIREFLQKPTRPARRSRVAALLGLVSALLLASGQGLAKARSSEKAVSVERNLEVEEAAATLPPSRVRGPSGGASPPTGDESLVPEAPKGSIREAKAAGSMPAREEDPRPDEKSSGRSSRRILARPDGTGTKSIAAAGSEKGHPAEETGESVTVSYAADTEPESQPIRDAAGNGASGFTEQAVTNRTGASGDRAGGTLPLRTVRQIEALLAKKAQRTPSQRKVSSRLLDAAREPRDRALPPKRARAPLGTRMPPQDW